MKRSGIAIGSAIFAVASTASLLGATGASAATTTSAATAATYNGACGSGYSVVNSSPVGTRGTVFLTYSRATARNCVVTVLTTPSSTPVRMTAWLQQALDHETTPVVESGDYRYYAGPVYLSGTTGVCVNWGGAIANQSTEVDHTNCG